MLVVDSNFDAEKIIKIRNALKEDIQKEDSFLISTIVSNIENQGYLFLDGKEAVEKQLRYLLSFDCAKLIFFNKFIQDRYCPITFVYSMSTFKTIFSWFSDNPLKVLTKTEVKDFSFRFVSTYIYDRIDFAASDEDMRKLFSYYIGKEQTLEETKILKHIKWSINE